MQDPLTSARDSDHSIALIQASELEDLSEMNFHNEPRVLRMPHALLDAGSLERGDQGWASRASGIL
jgi:hypothetical protein